MPVMPFALGADPDRRRRVIAGGEYRCVVERRV